MHARKALLTVRKSCVLTTWRGAGGSPARGLGACGPPGGGLDAPRGPGATLRPSLLVPLRGSKSLPLASRLSAEASAFDASQERLRAEEDALSCGPLPSHRPICRCRSLSGRTSGQSRPEPDLMLVLLSRCRLCHVMALPSATVLCLRVPG